MSDILDINTVPEFEEDEASNLVVQILKEKAQKRKGRGFQHDNYQHCTDKDAKENIPVKVFATRPTVSKTKFNCDYVIPEKSVEGWVLILSGIHEEATEEDILNKFSEISQVKNVRANLDRRTGFMKSYALIEYESYEDATKAVEDLNDTEFLGFNIKVNWCFIKNPTEVRKLFKHSKLLL